MNINIIPINGQIFKVCPLHLGLPQPSNEHRTFMKGSEEPATSVHSRENKKWRNPHRVSHPSFWALWIPSLLRVSKALAVPLETYLQHQIPPRVPPCWWAPRPAAAGWLPPWSHPPWQCHWWKGLCLPLAAVHTCSSQWEKREWEEGDKEKEERREKNNPTSSHELLLPGKSVTRHTKYWHILQKWPQRENNPWKGTRKKSFVDF